MMNKTALLYIVAGICRKLHRGTAVQVTDVNAEMGLDVHMDYVEHTNYVINVTVTYIALKGMIKDVNVKLLKTLY